MYTKRPAIPASKTKQTPRASMSDLAPAFAEGRINSPDQLPIEAVPPFDEATPKGLFVGSLTYHW